VKKAISILTSAFLLVGCTTVSGPTRVINKDYEINPNCSGPDCDALKGTSFHDDANAANLENFLRHGLDLQIHYCDVYLQQVLEVDHYNRAVGDFATSAGAQGTAILSLVNPGALATKVVGIATGVVSSTDSVYGNDFLFSNQDKYALEQAVLKSFYAYKDETLATISNANNASNLTWGFAAQQLYQSYNECTWPRITNIISTSLNATAKNPPQGNVAGLSAPVPPP